MIENIQWLGHDSFRIQDEDIVIYIDPWKIKRQEKADIILITHEHYDHLSMEDVNRLQNDDTVIVTTPEAAQKLTGNVKTASPGDKMTVRGIPVEAVPAYNINKKFHPKETGKLGFIVTVKNKRIYHAGDTDVIPEMEMINCDIALLPVSGTYVMTAEEAADAVSLIKPGLAIPMHYGEIVGDVADAEKFKELADCKVEILQKSD